MAPVCLLCGQMLRPERLRRAVRGAQRLLERGFILAIACIERRQDTLGVGAVRDRQIEQQLRRRAVAVMFGILHIAPLIDRGVMQVGIQRQILGGNALRGLKQRLILRGGLLIRRVVLHIGWVNQEVRQSVPLCERPDRNRIVFHPVFAEITLENGEQLRGQRHEHAVRILHEKGHGPVRIDIGGNRVPELLRQLEGAAECVAVIAAGRERRVLELRHGVCHVGRDCRVADVLRICVFERQRVVERYAEVGGQRLAHTLRYGVDVAAVRSHERGLVVGHVLITGGTGCVYQPVDERHAADRLAAEVEDDNVARIQRRQIGEGNGTEGVRADREHICAAHGGNILLNAGRLPVTCAGFLHLDIDRVAAVGEGQLNDINIRAAADVGAHDALNLGHIRDPAGF